MFLPKKNMETPLNPNESVAITLIDGFEPYFLSLETKKKLQMLLARLLR